MSEIEYKSQTITQTIILYISIASMNLGAAAAMTHKNLTRLLAYSSIGHIGNALAGAVVNHSGL